MSQNKPLVSICIPVFNGATYLKHTIQSALDQSWANKEIIIVDDGSSDNSFEIAKSYASNIIKVFRQENKGASAARNKAIKFSTGKFIQFLDSDDLLSSDKIKSQVLALTGSINKLAVCSTIHFNSGHNPYINKPSPYEEKFIYTTDDTIDFMTRLWGGYNLEASMIQTNAWLVPRSLIEIYGNWNEYLSLDDDGEFFARMALNSNGIIKTVGYNYYRKFSGLSKSLSSTQDPVALKSAIDSVILKKQYLLDRSSTKNAQLAIYKQLKELQIKNFPKRHESLKTLKRELSGFPNYKLKIELGGRCINAVAVIFGWRCAKLLQYLLSK